MTKKHIEGTCYICGCVYDAFTTAYFKKPFIDGKPHKEICWTCDCVPKMYELTQHYDDGYCIHDECLVIYNCFNSKRLNTVEEMMRDGFPPQKAKQSIKAVKLAIRNGKPIDMPSEPVFAPISNLEIPKTPEPVICEDNVGIHRRKRNKRRKNKVMSKTTFKDKTNDTSKIMKREVTIKEIKGSVD